jgi:hypothetical protein
MSQNNDSSGKEGESKSKLCFHPEHGYYYPNGKGLIEYYGEDAEKCVCISEDIQDHPNCKFIMREDTFSVTAPNDKDYLVTGVLLSCHCYDDNNEYVESGHVRGAYIKKFRELVDNDEKKVEKNSETTREKPEMSAKEKADIEEAYPEDKWVKYVEDLIDVIVGAC